jgi:hypothetical protein
MGQTFIDTLKNIRSGEAVDDLSEQMTGLVAAVRASGRAGKLTLVITVKPASKGNVNTLMVDDAITVKKPLKETETTIFFSTDTNELQRNDPRQPELTGLRRPAEVHNMNDVREAKAGNGN